MAHPDTQGDTQALIVGISGPSSSGKTTLARLLQRIFCGVRLERSSDVRTQSAHDGHSREDEQEKTGRLNTFIIHEDDFYFPDDQYVPGPILILPWIRALLMLLSSTLDYNVNQIPLSTEYHTRQPLPAHKSKTGTPPPQSTFPSLHNRSPTSDNMVAFHRGYRAKKIKMRFRIRGFRMMS